MLLSLAFLAAFPQYLLAADARRAEMKAAQRSQALSQALNEHGWSIPVCWLKPGETRRVCTNIATLTNLRPSLAVSINNELRDIVSARAAARKLETRRGAELLKDLLRDEVVLSCPRDGSWRKGIVTVGGTPLEHLRRPDPKGRWNATLEQSCKDGIKPSVNLPTASSISVLMDFFGQNAAGRTFRSDYDTYLAQCQAAGPKNRPISEGGNARQASDDLRREAQQFASAAAADPQPTPKPDPKPEPKKPAQPPASDDAWSQATINIVRGSIFLAASAAPIPVRIVVLVGVEVTIATIKTWDNQTGTKLDSHTGGDHPPHFGHARWDDCFDDNCVFASCEQQAYTKAMRDAIARRMVHNDCADAVRTGPDQNYVCPERRRDGAPLTEEERNRLARQSCEERRKVYAMLGEHVDVRCDQMTLPKLEKTLRPVDICTDPRARCEPGTAPGRAVVPPKGAGKGPRPGPTPLPIGMLQ